MGSRRPSDRTEDRELKRQTVFHGERRNPKTSESLPV